MDREDLDHFKTIANRLGEPLDGWLKRPGEVNSHSDLDPAYCLMKAKTIAGFYRRDEAQDPDIFTTALGVIIGEYSTKVIEYATDPRTGIITEFPNGLPNVGQIREYLNSIAKRMELLAQPRRRAEPYVPPPLKPGQLTYGQFLEHAAQNKLPSRPIGAFEKGGYLGPRN